MAHRHSRIAPVSADPVSQSRRPKPAVAELEAKLGYEFADPDLLEQALTHVSATPSEAERISSYQRMEFLGDRVLGLAVADMLFEAFPNAHEGELSQRFAHLVRRETCAEVAVDWNVGPFMRLGSGEAQTGGRKKAAILADICEALIGAAFLDSGFEAARDLVQRGWRSRMLESIRPLRDSKTALQEWAQARGLPTPIYSVVERSGPHHAPQFLMSAEIVGFSPAQARGSSKRQAEQAAARAFLEREGVLTPTAEGTET